jgi:hypothetical protein
VHFHHTSAYIPELNYLDMQYHNHMPNQQYACQPLVYIISQLSTPLCMLRFIANLVPVQKQKCVFADEVSFYDRLCAMGVDVRYRYRHPSNNAIHQPMNQLSSDNHLEVAVAMLCRVIQLHICAILQFRFVQKIVNYFNSASSIHITQPSN